MPEQSNQNLIVAFKKISYVGSAVPIIIGSSVFFGYILNNQFLKSIFPGFMPMNPAVAVAFLLGGISLFILNRGKTDAMFSGFGIACAAFITLIGFIKIAGILAGHDIYIDTHFFAEQLNAEALAAGRLIRIAPTIAANLFLAGAALLLLYKNKKERLAQALSLIVFFIALVTLLGYIYDASNLLEFSTETPMALSTAIAFMALATGILFARPSRGFMPIAASENAGGALMRTFIPAAVFIPAFLGYIADRAEIAGILIHDLLLPVLIAANIIVFILLISRLAAKIGGIDNERQAVNETLRQEKAKSEILLDSIGDGVIAIDRSWNIILWNKTTAELTGYAKEEALGKPFRDVVKFIRASDKKENIAFIEETMLFGKPHFMENHTLLVRKDGREISVGDSAAPVFDQNGKVSGAIIVFRDVSKEHELEEMRQEFASLATHQLRTPISIIKGYVSILLEGKQNPDEQKESLMKIQQVNERLLALVNAMLNISRIESGAIAIAPELSYIPELVDDVVKEMSSQIEGKKLRIEKQYAADMPSVSVDPKLIGAILRNLLSNAVKYTPEGGMITVKIGKQEQNALIMISDTGLGIPKEQQPKMFTKFFRADNVQAQHTEGTGLGLYVVKSILEQSGGAISFVSEENKGTTFFITIPLSGMKKREGSKGLT